jgi:hypothetical protein
MVLLQIHSMCVTFMELEGDTPRAGLYDPWKLSRDVQLPKFTKPGTGRMA